MAEDIDGRIFAVLATDGHATPKQISEHRLRENVVRLRCRGLVSDGLLQEPTSDVFRLSEDGREVAASKYDLDPIQPTCLESISTMGDLEPEDVKWQNERYLSHPDHRYDLDRSTEARARQEISVTRNGDLSRVMEEFPFSEPLPDQCAHWVRAIVGLHFFPDANHRTAMTTLNTILALNGMDRVSWRDKRYRTAIFKSKLVRRFVVDVRFDTLWYEDELFKSWQRYFTELLYGIPEYRYPEPNARSFETLLD